MKREAGHEFLARLGKRRLRPGGIAATNWLLGKAEFGKDKRVLEVACNMGTTMVRIGRHYPCRVIGVDLDEGALEKAGRNIRRAGLQDRLSVQRADAYCLPFPDQSFDILINEAMLTMLTGDGKDRALSEYCSRAGSSSPMMSASMKRIPKSSGSFGPDSAGPFG